MVQQEGKPNRHIYDLTERGIELLHASPCDFPPEQAANEIERVNEFARLAYEAHLLHPQPNGKPDMIDDAIRGIEQYPEPYRRVILEHVALGPMLDFLEELYSHRLQFDPPEYQLIIEEYPTPVPGNHFQVKVVQRRLSSFRESET